MQLSILRQSQNNKKQPKKDFCLKRKTGTQWPTINP